MAQLYKGIFFSKNDRLKRSIESELVHAIGVTHRSLAEPNRFEFIQHEKPDLLLIEVPSDGEQAFTLAERVARSNERMSLFMVSSEKNPDHILRGMRLNLDDFFVFPEDRGNMYPRIRSVLEHGNGSIKTGLVTALFSLKGGLGVTSLSIHLADQLHALKHSKVLLLDFNLYHGDVNVYLNHPDTYTAFDLLRDVERLDENLLFSSITQHPSGIFVMGTSDDISDADLISGSDVERMIDVLKRHFDMILIDLPHDFSDKVLSTVVACDLFLLITGPAVPDVKATHSSLRFLKELSIAPEKLQIVYNRKNHPPAIDCHDLEAIFKQPLFAQIENDVKRFDEATFKGTPLRSLSGGRKVKKDIERLAAQIAGVTPRRKNVAKWQKWMQFLLN